LRILSKRSSGCGQAVLLRLVMPVRIVVLDPFADDAAQTNLAAILEQNCMGHVSSL